MGNSIVPIEGNTLKVDDNEYELTPGLIMLMLYKKPRPQHYPSDGYYVYKAIVAHTSVWTYRSLLTNTISASPFSPRTPTGPILPIFPEGPSGLSAACFPVGSRLPADPLLPESPFKPLAPAGPHLLANQQYHHHHHHALQNKPVYYLLYPFQHVDRQHRPIHITSLHKHEWGRGETNTPSTFLCCL